MDTQTVRKPQEKEPRNRVTILSMEKDNFTRWKKTTELFWRRLMALLGEMIRKSNIAVATLEELQDTCTDEDARLKIASALFEIRTGAPQPPKAGLAYQNVTQSPAGCFPPADDPSDNC